MASGDRLAGATAESRAPWLELSVAADLEAVEAVSEILGRVAPVGTSVEPAFELVEEGLGARVDPTRPAIVRAYLPARRRRRRRARAIAEASEALGHLQAFGLRPIGELTTRVVHEADWAEAWKEHFPVLRVGRRLVIRPTWREHEATARRRRRRARPGHGVRDGPPPDDAAVPRGARAARGPRRARRRRASSTSAAARGSWRSRRCGSARRRRSGSTPTRSRSRRRSRTPRATSSRGGIRRRRGLAAQRRAAVRCRPREPDRRRSSSRWRRSLRAELRPAARCSRRGSSSTGKPRSQRRSRLRASPITGHDAEGDWVVLEATPA